MSDALRSVRAVTAHERNFRVVVCLLACILFAVLAVGWLSDSRSCRRQIKPRTALRQFVHSDADFQRALRQFDQVAGNAAPRRWVTLDGHRHFWTADQVRSWVAGTWDDTGRSLPVPNCSGLLPPID